MTRVLLISPDRVGPQMAGPGIRYLELARELARNHEVVLAAPAGSEEPGGSPPFALYDPLEPRTLEALARGRHVVIAPPLAPRLASAAARPARWIVDLYNPEPFEGLEFQKGRGRLERRVRDLARIDRLAFAARVGAAFVCASERQRDMWLGFLAANRRLASDRYAEDPELRSLIDVVELGVPEEPPRPGAAPALRGRVFPPDARIMLWNGGIWDWLDPLTVIRAAALLRASDPRWCLAFLGTARPGAGDPMGMGARAAALAAELGLGDDAVHFRAGWTPYDERGALLLECDIGVSAHWATLETRFAYRTRMLDFVWAGLPVVTVAGDEWAVRVEGHGLGEVVPPADPAAFAAAAARVAARGREEYAEPFRAVAAAQTWRAVARPLLRLVEAVQEEPRRSPPLVARLQRRRHSALSSASHVWRGRVAPVGRRRR